MNNLNNFEELKVRKNLGLIKDMKEENSHDYLSSGIYLLREICNIYCLYSEMSYQVITDEVLENFIKNFDVCEVKYNKFNFKISFRKADVTKFIKANYAKNIAYGEEEYGVVSSPIGFQKMGEPIVYHREVISSKDYDAPITKCFKIGPLRGLAEIRSAKERRFYINSEGIRSASGFKNFDGIESLFYYDMYAYTARERGKVNIKKSDTV